MTAADPQHTEDTSALGPLDEASAASEVSAPARLSVLWRWLLPGAIVAAFVRAWALADLNGSFLERPLLLDHAYYWAWAGEIANGQLVGDDTFEMDPGYAYWLGLWRALLGDSLWVPRLLNLVHSLIAVVGCGYLAYEVLPSSAEGRVTDEGSSDGGADHQPNDCEQARRRRAGHAALVMAVFPVTLYYDLLVMKTSMMVAALPWIVWLAWRAARADGWRASVLAGIAFGVGCTIRGNLLPLLPLFVAMASGLSVRGWRGALRTAAWRRRALAFMLAVGAVFTLPLAHNLAAGGTTTLLTTGGGEVFYLGTRPEGGGEYVRLPFVRPHPRLEHQDFRDEAARRLGHEIDRAQASQYWWRQGLTRIADDPLGWTSLEARKALLLLGAFEHPDSASFYFWAGIITPLGLLGPLHFGLLFPLVLAGMLTLAMRRRRVRWSLAAAAFGYVAVFLLFFVYSRFRVPAAPLLIPLAVAGVQELWRAWRADRRVALVGIGVLLLSAFVLGRAPAADPDKEMGIQYTNYGSWYAAHGETAAAAALLEQGVEVGNYDAAALLGRLWLDEPGREKAGIALIREAVKAKPTDPLAVESYATVLYRHGAIADAETLARSVQLSADARRRLDRERAAAIARTAADDEGGADVQQ